jgi:hypothetical protein
MYPESRNFKPTKKACFLQTFFVFFDSFCFVYKRCLEQDVTSFASFQQNGSTISSFDVPKDSPSS